MEIFIFIIIFKTSVGSIFLRIINDTALVFRPV